MSRYNISNSRAKFVDQTGALTKFGKDVLDKISEVVGLPSGDRISAIELDTASINNSIASLESDVSSLETRADSIEDYKLKFQTIYSDTTGVKNTVYTCINGLTLNLPSGPNNGDRVFIKRRGGPVLVQGNGKLIDGFTIYRMLGKDEGIQLMYLNGEWSKI